MAGGWQGKVVSNGRGRQESGIRGVQLLSSLFGHTADLLCDRWAPCAWEDCFRCRKQGSIPKRRGVAHIESFHNARLIRGDLGDKPIVTGRLHTKTGSLCDRSSRASTRCKVLGPGWCPRMERQGVRLKAGGVRLVKCKSGRAQGDPWHSQA